MRTLAFSLISAAKSRLVKHLKKNGGSVEWITEKEKTEISHEDVYAAYPGVKLLWAHLNDVRFFRAVPMMEGDYS